MSTRLHPLVPLAVLAFAAGCDETLISVSSDGRIEVAVSTNGSDPDTDGFSVTVDGGTAQLRRPGRERGPRQPERREPQRPAQRAGGELPGRAAPTRVPWWWARTARATCRSTCAARRRRRADSPIQVTTIGSGAGHRWVRARGGRRGHPGDRPQRQRNVHRLTARRAPRHPEGRRRALRGRGRQPPAVHRGAGQDGAGAARGGLRRRVP